MVQAQTLPKNNLSFGRGRLWPPAPCGQGVTLGGKTGTLEIRGYACVEAPLGFVASEDAGPAEKGELYGRTSPVEAPGSRTKLCVKSHRMRYNSLAPAPSGRRLRLTGKPLRILVPDYVLRWP
jgi:hypothetical protein